jgi:hypothetical protein
MGAPSTLSAPARIRKIGALLSSTQAGEATAAAQALHRLADGLARAAEHQQELEACLGFATDALGALAREVEQLRQDNARLRRLRHRRNPDAPRPSPSAAALS